MRIKFLIKYFLSSDFKSKATPKENKIQLFDANVLNHSLKEKGVKDKNSSVLLLFYGENIYLFFLNFPY